MDFLFNYGLFLTKVFTIAIFITSIIKITCFSKNKRNIYQKMDLCFLNNEFYKLKNRIRFYQKKQYKKNSKETNNKKFFNLSLYDKLKTLFNCKKNRSLIIKPTLYVLNFKGDIFANQISHLRKEITAIISVAQKNDEVLLCLESAGGIVNAYGLAASQLQRLRAHDIYLTISIDKIAASGGYMMACVANYIIASSFAIVGSIGVIAQIPNFHRWLKKNNIDIEQHIAGKYKRTLTLFGENTEESRLEFCKQLTITHDLFKKFVFNMRPKLNIDTVSNGSHWFGCQAKDLGLVDAIQTSDDFMLLKMKKFNLLRIGLYERKSLYSFIYHNMFKLVQFCIFKFNLKKYFY
ncbi:protease SohB [Buchnera aphidicola (Hormaphis cornu)]|nr:protease SohB [Buchnera aphidicola (Hormaphis cornu)]